MGFFGYVIIVVVSIIVVITIITLMIRTLPGRTRMASEVREDEPRKVSLPPFLQRIKSRFTRESDEGPEVPTPPLEEGVEEPPTSTVEPVVIPFPEAAPESNSDPSLETEVPVSTIEEEEIQDPDTGTLQNDDDLNTFRIEIAEDDGLSRIAESLEDIDLDKLSEMAKDISRKRREKSGR